jgi:NHLM bacteriocin system ABC transporter peptidase/ATP-binding protein/NHLM bacteriocin system ABC transporter ATP-binding protein
MAGEAPRKYRPVKTPTVLQMESAECGAAALGIILEYHGRYVPLDILRDDCGVSRDGSNAFYIKEAARRYGLEVKAIRKPAGGLFTRQPPFIVLWQWNHFLVVEGKARSKIHLNDPACGRRTVGHEEFARSYSEIALTFTPGPDFQARGRRPSAIRGLARRLAGSKSALLFVILAGLALVIPTLVTAAYQRVFVDEILVQNHRDWLRPLLIAMALTALVRLAAVALQQVYLTRLETRLGLTESVRFLEHVLRLPVSFFQHRFAGDIVGRIMSSARVARLISGELATTAVSLLTLVFFVAAMLPQDAILTAVGVAIGSLNLLALRWFSRWRIDQNRSIEQIRGRLWAGVMWAIQIIETVKATGSESDLIVRWTGDQARVVTAEQQLGAYDSLLIAIPPLLSTLTTIVVLGLGGYHVSTGTLKIGALVAFQSLLASFNQPFRDLARLGAEVQELRADLDRIDDVRHHRIDPVLQPTSASTEYMDTLARREQRKVLPRLTGHLELRAVTFGYNRTVEEPLIKEFSLTVRPGQRIALVGSSGSGKTTLARLITGLYQPWSGAVLHDGRRIEEIPRELFVNSVALVDERIAMFQGSVRDNLTLWDERISSERLIQAGLGAAIHRDLLLRRGGYDAAVAEGARNFSGGQRQRLEIARSLVRDPSLLVLDEATSALDPRTESLVDDHLRRLGCTCLIIAHRLSTIRDCDEIIVLSGGRVVQRGTHDQLIRLEGGEYASLHAGQELPPRLGSRHAVQHPSAARTAITTASVTAGDRSSFAPRVEVARAEANSHVPAYRAGVDNLASPMFLIEELLPYSQPAETAANRPLPLDDPEAVWWITSGQVDVFFTLQGLGGEPGRRRHLCRVEEGGSIFSLSGVRGHSGGGLLAVGVGTAHLLKFARGDLIRLSFEENLAGQVALMIEDWILRLGRALGHSIPSIDRDELSSGGIVELPAGGRFGIREGVAWVRRQGGQAFFLDDLPLPVTEHEARFPITEHLWLAAGECCRVSVCGTVHMIQSGDPWAGLMDFHRAVLDDIGRTQEREARRRWTELQQAVAGERALLREFSDRLAAVANEAAATPDGPREGRGLLAACRAIGRELGIEVRAPRMSSDDASDEAAESLGEIARASGFHVRQVALPQGWATGLGGEPLLARLADESDRPVALIPSGAIGPRRATRYEVFDPVMDRRRPLNEALSRRIAPIGWMFYRTLPDHPLGLPDLLRFSLPGVHREARLVLALAILGGLLGLAVPIASGVLLDQVIPEVDFPGMGPDTPGSGKVRLLTLCLFLAALAVSIAVFQVIEGLTLLRIEGKIVPALVPAVWDRLLRLPTRFFAEYSSGDLALRAMGLSAIFKKVSGAVVTTLVTGLISFFNLVLMFWYSWRLGAIVGALLSILLAATFILLAGQLRQEARIRTVEGSIIGFLLELVGGITKLRIAGAENRAFGRWAGRHAEQIALVLRARRYSNRLHLLYAVFPAMIAIVIYAGTIYLDPSRLSPGSFLALSIAAANVTTSILAVGLTLMGLLDLPPHYARVRPILEARPEFPAAVAEPVRLGGALALNAVSFHYPGQDDGSRVLDDVSLQVRPGEFVAVVGASGSGKSTILRLLLGFEGPDRGTVTYDGRELATLDLREVRRQIGVVLQHAELMPGDLFSNIVGFDPALTLDDAWRAARLAGLEDEIRRLPMGMHTLVGEGGGNLSGGQRQRLLIARAIVRRPRILILDEATSALDNVNQAIVTESITRELKGVTRLVIAHRLTTVIYADRIYVMKKGRIVQAGNFEQLLAEPGPFQEQVHRQAL